MLKDKPQFCCWKYEERSGKKTKVPYNPVTRNRAKPNQRGTFKDFSSAIATISDYDGIGFLVGNDICVIDLDDCFDSSGKLKPVAQNVVEAFRGCYMEHSPSGKGLHIFFKATGYDFDKAKYYVNNRKLGVEIYVGGATNRFVTVTGNVYADGDIAEKSHELQMILDKYMLRPTPVKQLLDTESQSYLSDKSVIEKALKSANRERFKALWQGDTSGYASASEADLALCGMLAFWCGRDIGQMDRLFRKSGLMRDKWNRPQSGSTYGMITIEKAIANATEIYKPGGKRSSATEDFGECSLADFKPESNDRYPWTDIGASRLFADYYKSLARFVPERKMWFCYENGIWIPDVGNLKVMEMCKSLANQLLTYALTIQDRFIHEIMSGDEEKAKFLQKAFGYSISGDTRYECLFVLYGATTRNCKGTLCESILKVLGSYGCTARPETISLKKNNNSSSPSEDIARLAGVRFVNISEPSRGLVLNAAQVKSMTGGDTINARFLHENSFDFSPKFKLYINTNYLPVITDMTLFSSGRVVIIPFERHFDENEQDKNLKREFAKPKNQSAILNWLIEGYQLLKKEGLTLPDSVKTATEAYKRDSDKIALFFEDALEESPNSEVRTSEVYARYQRWCSANGCYSENARNFKQALTAIARVERKRPRSGGGMTTMLIGYKLTEEEFLLI